MSPVGHQLGLGVVFVPVVGALVIGLMARYGSERIRGHGIPEAIEAILINGSRVEPRVAFLKPLSVAISIGSGGPFGAEGPIIMTGGARAPTRRSGILAACKHGAILGGTMRSPFTGVIFSLELTHDVNMMLPLLVATTLAHGFTVLAVRRSILTEKVSRRGYRLSREYAIDPLEILFVREVLRTKIVARPARLSVEELASHIHADSQPTRSAALSSY